MNFVKELIKTQTPDYYDNFLRRDTSITIDKNRVNLEILYDDERRILKIPTNGDSTLVLRYKEKEGAVLSMKTKTSNLVLVQLQGAKNGVSYSVTTGITWVELFGNQVEKIISHPKNRFELLSMPSMEEIDGLYDAGSEKAAGKYKQLANILGLRFSKEDWKFVRSLK
jgi:hypothetical protein